MVDWLVPLLGTLVTVAGLVVAAPYAAGRLLPDVWAVIRHRGDQMRARIAQWLRWDVLVNAGSLNGTLPIVSSAFGSGVVRRVARADESVEKQVAALRRAVELIHVELDDLRDEQVATRAELGERLDRVSAELAELRQHVQAQEAQARQLDARGFPLAAVGALVAGLPNAPFTWWWWALLAIGALAAAVAVRWLCEPGSTRAEVLKGWHRVAVGDAA